MYQIVYLSSAVEKMSEETLNTLLNKARVNNTAYNVTGMLLYHDGNFIQVLEGEEQTLKLLYEIISRDRRHSGVFMLLSQPIDKREFPDWSMGFKSISVSEYQRVMGYFNPIENPKISSKKEDGDSNAISLLKVFRETNITRTR